MSFREFLNDVNEATEKELNKARGEEYSIGSDVLIFYRADKIKGGFYLWFDEEKQGDNQFGVLVDAKGKIKSVEFYKNTEEFQRNDLIKSFEPIIRTIFDI